MQAPTKVLTVLRCGCAVCTLTSAAVASCVTWSDRKVSLTCFIPACKVVFNYSILYRKCLVSDDYNLIT